MPLGLYISIPFCRSKCSFCNFASGVFSREKMNRYVERLVDEIAQAESLARSLGARFEREVDSIYFGGGTPTTLLPEQLRDVFQVLRDNFALQPHAEITVECAPGTLHPKMVEVLLAQGTNRMSLGTQSFVDQEIKSVGRLHTAEQTRNDIAMLRQSGIENISLDLIAGLPHQTRESWRISLDQVAESRVPHASLYMLEVDEDSRLGRELIAGGTRYHAHHVPDSDLTADLYLEAGEFLKATGILQYEISNFARSGFQSRHNLKYWTRQPYLGFGLDAHSMLASGLESDDFESVRFGNPDDLTQYLAGIGSRNVSALSQRQAVEEFLFLGLRLNRGIDLGLLNPKSLTQFGPEIEDLSGLGLVERQAGRLQLTERGRLLSNEVFERFVGSQTEPSGPIRDQRHAIPAPS